MTVLPYLAIGLIAIGLFLRYAWASYLSSVYAEAVVRYAILAELPDREIEALSALWPMWQIVAQFWQWDFRRYIVDQQGYQNLLDFLLPSGKLAGK